MERNLTILAPKYSDIKRNSFFSNVSLFCWIEIWQSWFLKALAIVRSTLRWIEIWQSWFLKVLAIVRSTPGGTEIWQSWRVSHLPSSEINLGTAKNRLSWLEKWLSWRISHLPWRLSQFTFCLSLLTSSATAECWLEKDRILNRNTRVIKKLKKYFLFIKW